MTFLKQESFFVFLDSVSFAELQRRDSSNIITITLFARENVT